MAFKQRDGIIEMMVGDMEYGDVVIVVPWAVNREQEMIDMAYMGQLVRMDAFKTPSVAVKYFDDGSIAPVNTGSLRLMVTLENGTYHAYPLGCVLDDDEFSHEEITKWGADCVVHNSPHASARNWSNC
jgi:hypothetical protein